jgi:hypothetical protein
MLIESRGGLTKAGKPQGYLPILLLFLPYVLLACHVNFPKYPSDFIIQILYPEIFGLYNLKIPFTRI